MDNAYGFSIMNQRSTGFGDLGKSSDVFVGGVPKVSYPIITLFIFRNSITFQPLFLTEQRDKIIEKLPVEQ